MVITPSLAACPWRTAVATLLGEGRIIPQRRRRAHPAVAAATGAGWVYFDAGSAAGFVSRFGGASIFAQSTGPEMKRRTSCSSVQRLPARKWR